MVRPRGALVTLDDSKQHLPCLRVNILEVGDLHHQFLCGLDDFRRKGKVLGANTQRCWVTRRFLVFAVCQIGRTTPPGISIEYLLPKTFQSS